MFHQRTVGILSRAERAQDTRKESFYSLGSHQHPEYGEVRSIEPLDTKNLIF